MLNLCTCADDADEEQYGTTRPVGAVPVSTGVDQHHAPCTGRLRVTGLNGDAARLCQVKTNMEFVLPLADTASRS